MDEKTKRKISRSLKRSGKAAEAARKRALDPEWRAKITESNRKAAQNPERNKKISLAHKGRTRSKESIEKQKATLKSLLSQPEYRRMLSDAVKGAWTDERRDRTRSSNLGKKRWGNALENIQRANKRNGESTRDKISNGDVLRAVKKLENLGREIWYGGIVYDDGPYCHLFNPDLKNRCKAYWGYRCFECGAKESDGMKLAIHHVHYDKKTCCNGSPRDLVPLCPSCHARTNHNRDYWENRFRIRIYDLDPGGKCFFTKKEYYEKFKN